MTTIVTQPKREREEVQMMSLPIPKFRTMEEKQTWLQRTGILEQNEKIVKFLPPPKLTFADTESEDLTAEDSSECEDDDECLIDPEWTQEQLDKWRNLPEIKRNDEYVVDDYVDTLRLINQKSSFI